MYRIDNSTAATTLPAPAGVGPNPNGYFTGGNPGVTPATIVDPDWANMVQETLCQAITGDGTALSKTDYTQLKAKLTGRLINVQIFTASGTYTPTPGTNSVIVEVQGAGGGAGAVPATASGQVAVGYGGGGGGYGRSRLLSGFSGIAVTVGAAGIGGVAGTNNGGSGGASSFGTLLVAGGGSGGSYGPANAFSQLISPGSTAQAAVTGANLFSVRGGAPGINILMSNQNCVSGNGGSTFFGPGAAGQSGAGFAGISAVNYGGGGSGAYNGASGASGLAGGNGGAGIVIVWEYS